MRRVAGIPEVPKASGPVSQPDPVTPPDKPLRPLTEEEWETLYDLMLAMIAVVQGKTRR